jgi:lysophospholipase L1-like esterase
MNYAVLGLRGVLVISAGLLALACSSDDANGGAGGNGGSGGGTCQTGTIAASQVVLIGDSYLAQPGNNIQYYLENLARAAGALEEGESYRPYYAGGTSMGNGQIPAQFDTAKAADPDIKLVIMTGGGNDILIGNRACLTDPAPQNESCVTTVDNSLAAAAELYQNMAASGVEDVVYFSYPHLPTGFLTGPAANEMLDYSYPRVQEACDSLTAPDCHFIDTRPAFEGNASLIGPDGVHPTPAGSEVIANLIWDVMQDNCLAQ